MAAERKQHDGSYPSSRRDIRKTNYRQGHNAPEIDAGTQKLLQDKHLLENIQTFMNSGNWEGALEMLHQIRRDAKKVVHHL